MGVEKMKVMVNGLGNPGKMARIIAEGILRYEAQDDKKQTKSC